MLGFTPPEWGYITTQETGVQVTQGFVRSLDRKVRMSPEKSLNANGLTKERIKALVKTACGLLSQGVPDVEPTQLHRLDKADTKRGLKSVRNLSGLGVPYACCFMSVFWVGPFAGHRDSVSELIGDSLESAIRGCSYQCRDQLSQN